MDYTIFTFHRYTVNAGTAIVGYRIDATCTDAGELPSAHVFAYKINDVNDSSADTFDHVATVHEIQNVIIGRDDAIFADSDIYFLTHVELEYEDLLVALQADAQFKSRLNELTRTWVTYRDDFAFDEQSVLYPSSAPEIEEEAIQAYADAREDREAAEVAATAAEAAVQSAQADIDNANEFLVVYQQQETYQTRIIDEVSTFKNKVTTLGTAASDYYNNTLC